MRPVKQSTLTALPGKRASLIRELTKKGFNYPVSRMELPAGIDYEGFFTGRLINPGDRIEVAGIKENKKNVAWVPIINYQAAAGVFQHIVPYLGECGILLPVEAELIKDSQGRLLFYKHRVPAAGRRSVIYAGIEATEALGRLVALIVLYGEMEGEYIRVKATPPFSAMDVNKIVAANLILYDYKFDGVDVVLRLKHTCASILKLFVQGKGFPPVKFFSQLFFDGVRDIFKHVEGCRIRASASRIGVILKLLTGAGLNWSIYSDTTIRVTDWMKDQKYKYITCRVETAAAPVRAAWPVTGGLCVHPTGLVYKL